MHTHPIPPPFPSPLSSAQPRLLPPGLHCHRPRASCLPRACSIPAPCAPVACRPRICCLPPSRSLPCCPRARFSPSCAIFPPSARALTAIHAHSIPATRTPDPPPGDPDDPPCKFTV
ncbi:hypothetical protein B0H14DRAFT_3484901 [Mycena olivaceomarginata]|nr:hypothetical protein B0H14DRAFT_3484901 [Mycena olivaceomarginata]